MSEGADMLRASLGARGGGWIDFAARLRIQGIGGGGAWTEPRRIPASDPLAGALPRAVLELKVRYWPNSDVHSALT